MSRYVSQDRIRAENQRRELSRDATLHKLHQDHVLIANESSHERVEAKRRLRVAGEQQREFETLRAMEMKQLSEEARAVQEEQEARLAAELQKMKHDQEVSERRRQQLREANVELRELESKLKKAYLNKEIHAQRTEKDHMSRTEREASLLVDQEFEAQRAREEELARLKEQQMLAEKRQYKKELQQQLGDKEAQQRAAYDEFLKEKLMIDEIVGRIYEEERRARELEMAKKQQTRKEMEDFKQQQEQWRAVEAERMARENEDIMRFAQAVTMRGEEVKAQVLRRAEERAALQGRIAEQVASEKATREELDRLREELSEQEVLEKQRQLEVKEIEAKLRQRLRLRAQQEEDLQERERLREKERAEEEAFRVALMEKFAADDKLDQMNAQKRRLKQLEHKRAVDVLLEERRQRFQFEKQQQMREAEAGREEAEARRAMIEHERQLLLKEHAQKLLGFLPKGVIRDRSDLDLLGENFKQAYAPPRSREWEED